MLSFFEPLKKLCREEKVAIDNWIFRSHYKVTVILLILGSVLLNGKQYFGDPIDCHLDSGVPAKIVSTFCWITGTYTVHGETPQNMMAHQGVGTNRVGQERVYHTYYQWVGFILFFQAILFYLPRHFWKMVEGGTIKFFTKGMGEPETSASVRMDRVHRLKELFQKFQQQPNRNRNYAIKFLFFEIINLVNVIVQIFFINKFLGGRFLKYGVNLLDFYNDNYNGLDPMGDVFPKVTKCTFRTHSIVADIIDHDAICVLSLNIVNEKVYLVMWLWLIVLAVMSGLTVIYRLAVILVPQLRQYMLWTGNNKWKHVADTCKNGQYGDWFLLRQMSKNVDQETFSEFLMHLSKESGLSWDNNSNPTRPCTIMRGGGWSGGFFSGSAPVDSGCESAGSMGLSHNPSKENLAFNAEEKERHSA